MNVSVMCGFTHPHFDQDVWGYARSEYLPVAWKTLAECKANILAVNSSVGNHFQHHLLRVEQIIPLRDV